MLGGHRERATGSDWHCGTVTAVTVLLAFDSELTNLTLTQGARRSLALASATASRSDLSE